MGGLGVCAVCLCYALPDWAMLQRAQHAFEHAANGRDFNALFAAATRQSIHRINIFAEIVWALLGAILAAIGIHGLARQPLDKATTVEALKIPVQR